MKILLQNTKLTSWRQTRGYSTHSLANVMQERMAPDFPNGFPRGTKITQTDIRRAESQISPKSFTKVTNALYKYFDVTPGYFGEYENPIKKYSQESESHQLLETTIEYQAQNINSLQKLTDTQSELIQQMRHEIAELKRQLLSLQKK